MVKVKLHSGPLIPGMHLGACILEVTDCPPRMKEIGVLLLLPGYDY